MASEVPCPGCGGAPEVTWGGPGSMVAHCPTCDWPLRESEDERGHAVMLYGAIGSNREEALAMWNECVVEEHESQGAKESNP